MKMRMIKKSTAILFVFLSILVFRAKITCADTYYVNGSCGNDTWSGLSQVCSDPNGPKLTISAGIAAASNGDTVIVADGSYSGAANKNLDFAGKAITLRSENGPNSTIIDCAYAGQAFIFQNGEDSNSVLDGFLIKSTYITSGQGAAMFLLNSSPTIRNCSIDYAQNYTSPYAYGGAIHIDGGKPLISNCQIAGGYAGFEGGGIYITNQTADPNGKKLRITNCYFYNNTGSAGGAIYIGIGSGEVVVNNCQFYNNGINQGNGDVVYGGAIFAAYGSPLTIIANSVFHNNLARYWGGAVYSSGPMKVVNCLFYANKTTGSSGSNPDWDGGGAIAVRRGTFEMSNSTLVSNSTYTSIGGSMVVELGGTANISNSIFWNDSIAGEPPALEYNGFFVSGTGSSASFTYCDLPANPYAFTYSGGVVNIGSGMLYLDPLFKNIYTNDYHLSDASALIDVGDNNSVMSDFADLDNDTDVNEPVPFDLDGNMRIFNQTVDMGAYEIGIHCPNPIAGDVNGDCKIDFLDFAQMVQGWLECNLVPQSACNN